MTRAEGNTGVLYKHGNESSGSKRGSVNTVMNLLDLYEAF
jgi:hypothetical protein